jgi:aldehyde dehydrogenase (NAD+)
MAKRRITSNVAAESRRIFKRFGIAANQHGAFSGTWHGRGAWLEKRSPIDGTPIGRVRQASAADYERTVMAARAAFLEWRDLPGPKRGEVVRRLGEALRGAKDDLGALVTIEAGKILPEGLGEVQEMIDICDFAVGLSRQLHGLTIASERKDHRMMEQWHPLGVVGIISAFNFPVAVWAWNSALAAVCGDATLWKPSEKTPFTAVACIKIAERVCRACGVNPAIFSLAIGDGPIVGELMSADRRVPLVSATGSVRMGRRVAEVVGQRLGRSLLELGGNNAIVVTPSADLDLATRAIVFGAAGTAGQRCTSTRRLFIHDSIYGRLLRRLRKAYVQIPVGNPLEEGTLMGPLIDAAAVKAMQHALAALEGEGGRVLEGGAVLKAHRFAGGHYVSPCIAEARPDMGVVHEETFAPILYVHRYRRLAEAIRGQNAVPQGLSSAIFTNDLREAELFLSARGSDCGIANVNIGTSGAEIGGAFGGEKDTGGGRESGSDSWKIYMRRQTVTVNFSPDLPLAQGIKFGG